MSKTQIKIAAGLASIEAPIRERKIEVLVDGGDYKSSAKVVPVADSDNDSRFVLKPITKFDATSTSVLTQEIDVLLPSYSDNHATKPREGWQAQFVLGAERLWENTDATKQSLVFTAVDTTAKTVSLKNNGPSYEVKADEVLVLSDGSLLQANADITVGAGATVSVPLKATVSWSACVDQGTANALSDKSLSVLRAGHKIKINFKAVSSGTAAQMMKFGASASSLSSVISYELEANFNASNAPTFAGGPHAMLVEVIYSNNKYMLHATLKK